MDDPADALFPGFAACDVSVAQTTIFARVGGKGPPVLFLHGFPQTHVMWHRLVEGLVTEFTVVCADLRGYGRSGTPDSAADHAPYSKRSMARDMVQLMAELGFDNFCVVGHDRGGRVAYRLALDHPVQVRALAVLDVVPTGDSLARADARFALAFWPWTLLAQPSPLPERLILGCPEAVVDDALSQWGSSALSFEPRARNAYVQALSDERHVHAICEEYRAAATLDSQFDSADLSEGRRILCPTLALWAQDGPLDTWYADAGGPLGVWSRWVDALAGSAVAGGHFFPEERPEDTLAHLRPFLTRVC